MSLTSSVISFALLSVTGEPTSIFVDLYCGFTVPRTQKNKDRVGWRSQLDGM